MTDYKIVFHIGYPKAASSSLQLNLFPFHSEIKNFSKNSSLLKTSPFKEFYNNIKLKESYVSNNKNDNWQLLTYFKSHLDSQKINIFSDEGLVNQFHSSHVNMSLKAKRIQSYFPKAKIIIIIRKQSDLLRSLYDFTPTKRSINKWLKELFSSSNYNDFLSSLEFDKTISLYSNLFGKENIGIFLFEELKFSPDIFSQKLSNFLGISKEELLFNLKKTPRNTYDGKNKKFKRLRSKIFPNLVFSNYLPDRIRNNIKQKIIEYIDHIKIIDSSKHSKINNKNMEIINNYYKTSNQKLIKKINLDLKKYNYPL
jgi:hypothetical protein